MPHLMARMRPRRGTTAWYQGWRGVPRPTVQRGCARSSRWYRSRHVRHRQQRSEVIGFLEVPGQSPGSFDRRVGALYGIAKDVKLPAKDRNMDKKTPILPVKPARKLTARKLTTTDLAAVAGGRAPTPGCCTQGCCD